MCVFGGEVSDTLVENLNHPFGFVCSRQRGVEGGFYAGAAKFIEVLEILRCDFARRQAPCGSGLIQNRQSSFADGPLHGMQALPRLGPAHTANQLFARFTCDPDENGARAERGTHSRGKSLEQFGWRATRRRPTPNCT